MEEKKICSNQNEVFRVESLKKRKKIYVNAINIQNEFKHFLENPGLLIQDSKLLFETEKSIKNLRKAHQSEQCNNNREFDQFCKKFPFQDFFQLSLSISDIEIQSHFLNIFSRCFYYFQIHNKIPSFFLTPECFEFYFQMLSSSNDLNRRNALRIYAVICYVKDKYADQILIPQVIECLFHLRLSKSLFLLIYFLFQIKLSHINPEDKSSPYQPLPFFQELLSIVSKGCSITELRTSNPKHWLTTLEISIGCLEIALLNVSNPFPDQCNLIAQISLGHLDEWFQNVSNDQPCMASIFSLLCNIPNLPQKIAEIGFEILSFITQPENLESVRHNSFQMRNFEELIDQIVRLFNEQFSTWSGIPFTHNEFCQIFFQIFNIFSFKTQQNIFLLLIKYFDFVHQLSQDFLGIVSKFIDQPETTNECLDVVLALITNLPGNEDVMSFINDVSDEIQDLSTNNDETIALKAQQLLEFVFN